MEPMRSQNITLRGGVPRQWWLTSRGCFSGHAEIVGITCRRAFEAQRGDRLQQTAPMAERGDAYFLEIIGGQIEQYFGADVILAECRLVAFQTQISQPTCDIHRRVSGSVTLKVRCIAWMDRTCPGTEDRSSRHLTAVAQAAAQEALHGVPASPRQGRLARLQRLSDLSKSRRQSRTG